MTELVTWLQGTTLSDVLVRGVNSVGRFVMEWPELVAFEAGCAAVAGGMWLMLRKNKKRTPDQVKQGEQDEMKRRVQLEGVYADRIHDFMLDMLGKGEITRKEYKRDCKRFGIAFRLFDLLRPARSKTGIKHRVLRNVAANHSTLQYIQPSPGPKPGENVPVAPVRVKRKVWLVVGKRRSAA